MKVEKASDKDIIEALEEAAKAAQEAVEELMSKPGIGAAVRRAQLIGGHGAITKVLHKLYRRLGFIITDQQEAAIQAAIEANLEWQQRILKAIEPNAQKRNVLQAAMREGADRNPQALVARMLHTQMPLSKQVYRSEALSKHWISKLVNSALAKGDSAADLAKKVRDYIHPGVRGGISYAAMRLARTEINNAFHAQAIKDAQEQPWVHGMKWNLSRVHERDPGDLCEAYARRGVFPTNAVPRKPHPQCRCFVTPEVMDLESLITRARSGDFSKYVSEKTSLAA